MVNIKNIHAILVIVMLILSAVAKAQVNGQLRLSYCNGEVQSSSKIGKSGGGVLSVAACFPTNMTSMYHNVKVKGVRVGLASKLNVSSVTVWVRSSLSGSNLVEKSIDKAEIVKGWNEISFDTPYSLPQNQDLYAGYTINMSGSSYPVSVVGSGVAGGFYYKDDSWTDRSSEGCVSIEAVITADNLPKYDLALTELSVANRLYRNVASSVSVTIENKASLDVSGYDVVCSIEGMPDVVNHVSEPIASGDTYVYTFDVVPEMAESVRELPFSVSVENLQDGEDSDESNNSLTATLQYLKYDFAHTVLLEEFTTEKCSNCPSAAAIIHYVLSDEALKDKVVAVCHHSGYMTDWLTIPADNEYLWLFGGSTSAPNCMYDRCPDASGTVPTVPTSVDVVTSKINAQLARDANCAIFPSAKYDADSNMVEVDVVGACDWDFDPENYFVTVYLIENNVKAIRQQGTSSDSEFYHNHVTRGVNATWGDPIDWIDNEFSYSCKLEMDASWKQDDMEVIVVVNKKTDDITDCMVENSARCDISFDTQSVAENFLPEEVDSIEYYDVYGNKMTASTLEPGIIIKVTSFANGKRKSEKILVR